MTRARPGLLLVQLGTPDAPTPRAVAAYLREFLGDPDVVGLPAPLRRLLVDGLVVPLRARRSAAAYRRIWTAEGSPLLVHSHALLEALHRRLPGTPIALGMRYGRPTLSAALAELGAAGARRLVVCPLYPHEADSTTGSARRAVRRLLARPGSPFDAGATRFLAPFFAEPAYLDALAESVEAALSGSPVDHVLFSYHGLPVSHVRGRADPASGCLAAPDCCASLDDQNARCYRAQCFATTRGVAQRLGLAAERFGTSFQSRLGPVRWIGPATAATIRDLARAGVRRLAVVCPSFVADCVETLEEIGLRGAETFREAGGDELVLVPALNARPRWVAALERIVRPLLEELGGTLENAPRGA